MINYSVVAAPIVVSVILLLFASPALGGGIRGGERNKNLIETNGNIESDKVHTTIDVSAIEEARRILNENEEESKSDSVSLQELSEESGDDDSNEDEEEKEDAIIKHKEEYVPIVSEDCADAEGLIEVTESGDKLNCRQIRKTKICEREHNGKPLYESCQKSCEICVEAIPTTDAPTADLVELVVTDLPTAVAYKSIAPSYQPTSITTELPTPTPSQYPTPVPTTIIPIVYIEEETEEPTFEKILDPEFINATTTVDDPTKYESNAPSYQPTIKFTDDPTATPSHYPTDSPTENEITSIMYGMDDDVMLSVLGEFQ